MGPAKLRDGAEGAAHVTALGDLHVGVGHATGEQPRRPGIVEVAGRGVRHPVLSPFRLVHELHDPVQLGGAEDGVDLGDLRQDLAAVALGETAGDDEGARPARLLDARELEDGIDRLLAGPVDEGAGVDDEALRRPGGVRELMAGLTEHALHELGVDLVLRTAEGGEVDFHARAHDPIDPRGKQTA